MKSGMVKAVAVLLAVGLIGALFFWIGKKSATPEITRLSQLTGKYAINEEIKCTNGRSLGWVQVDIDLAKEKLRVVRNDPGRHPSCALP